jgi:hypothetical protein
MIHAHNKCINDTPNEIPCIFDSRKEINFSMCAKHNNVITLIPSLTQHYAERSQATGKTIPQLVLQDLAALHKKRVAREEKRVWKENEYERL